MTIKKPKIYKLNEMSIEDIAEDVSLDIDLRLSIAENMKSYGGSFVKALGECLIRADISNSRKLASIFIEYILNYQPEAWPKK